MQAFGEFPISQSKISKTSFDRLPVEAYTSFGGYTGVKPEHWRRYMASAIRSHYPWFPSTQQLILSGQDRWQENNCIFAALKKYLFEQFGFLAPEDSLFKIYNLEGDGVTPANLIEAIRSVIEPLGFEINKILVPDSELRAGMGFKELVVDLSHSAEFDGQPGVAMINIKNGYNHAFFWRRMEKDKFTKEEFRIATLIQRQGGGLPGKYSPIHCFEELFQLFGEYLSENKESHHLLREISLLSEFLHIPENCQGPGGREHILLLMDSIERFSREYLSSLEVRKASINIQFAEEACHLVGRVLQESEVIC